MKIKNRHRLSTSDSVVNISIPQSWEALSQKQLVFTLRLLAGELDIESCRAILFRHLSCIDIIGHAPEPADGSEGGYIVTIKGIRGPLFLAYREIVWAYDSLEWFGKPPAVPVRPDCIAGAHALHPRLAGASFESFLACESFFQGYIATGDESLIREMVALLYPGIRKKKIDGFAITAVFFWFSGLKTWLQARYPDFFRPAANSGTEDSDMPDMGAIIRTQLRALSKGDVTKNAAVLAAELHDALHELNALAAEYERVKADSRKN